MRRGLFLTSVLACFAGPRIALAGSPLTVVVLSCSSPEFEQQAEDTLAGLLRERGVSALAPEAMDVTIREHLSVEVDRWIGGGRLDASYVETITRRYNATRAFLAEMQIRGSSLPYGGFTVYNVRSTCSYRCFDTVSKGIVVAGSASGEGRGEDIDAATQQSLQAALKGVARETVGALRS
jgi:hypothetical protein